MNSNHSDNLQYENYVKTLDMLGSQITLILSETPDQITVVKDQTADQTPDQITVVKDQAADQTPDQITVVKDQTADQLTVKDPIAVNDLPSDFNWKHYVALNPSVKILTEEYAKEHYILYGKKLQLRHNFSRIYVLIYSGGKTASSTLMRSFMGVAEGLCWHAHCDWEVHGYLKMSVSDVVNCPRHKQLLIVSSYREPIGRHISSFFEGIYRYLNPSLDTILQMDTNFIMSQLIQLLRTQLIESYHPFLENNKGNIDNIDIFKKPFNKEDGYQVYETEKVKLIQLRMDKINNWVNIIRDNTEYTGFELLPSNETCTKPIYDIYKKVCKEIIMPKDLLDTMFSIEKNNLKYFYTTEEITEIKKKWYRDLPK